MKLLVTGATGFIGANLVPRLLSANYEVALLVREEYAAGRRLPASLQQQRRHLQLVYADLRNLTLTRRALAAADADAIIHLAARGSTDPFLSVDAALRHNVNGTINLLRVAFERGNYQRCIVARTPGERSAMNVYAASKAAAWNFCRMYVRTSGWPIVGAMIYQSYGWGQPVQALIPSAVHAAVAGESFAMTSGDQQRDWIHVDDVAGGLLAALSADLAPGTTVELGSGQAHSVAAVVNMIYDFAESSAAPQIGVLPSRPGEVACQIADLAHNSNLAWRAAIPLKKGLRDYLACYHRAQRR